MKSSDERLLRLLQEARQALETERRRRTEPLAIVGIGCRFPGGASSPEEYWHLLERAVDASTTVPRERWDARASFDPDPRAPGKSYATRGSFLPRIDEFEPAFFGISPREAVGLDPQQRLLLEVAWEALEDAGIAPTSLKGTSTGVWVGLSLDDYARLSVPSGRLETIDAYTSLGNARSVAAGRIAYVLGVHGPVLQLDTACSSSLVAVHLAAQSLRSGECDLALVGGVSLMSSPETMVALCKLQALSPDGRCKTFDASADGYGRGEGCGVIVLKRLADASAAGDRVYAVLRGSAINHDGPSNGLTAPNGVAQDAVIRAALANAGLDASRVSYVEAHGTGTLLGDPIEVLALSRVYGPARSFEEPLHLGSVKTNFGHLEAAAGVASLIKTALCLARGRLVPHLHFREPNPKIPWSELPLRVTVESRALPTYGPKAVAAVSSFGISGTNAHVLLEQAEPPSPRPATVSSAELVVLSAATDASLVRAAARLRAHLDAHPTLALADVAHSLVATRASFPLRWAAAVDSRAELCAALDARVRADPTPRIATNERPHAKLAFVFSGQGSQWLGMGQHLLREEPVFHAAILDCERVIRAETGWSVLAELSAEPDRSRLARVEVVQPVLFAIQIALARLWCSWGVEPDAVVGHSMGEIAAACVAGALTLQDGAAIVCRRSALLARIAGRGEMALVELSIADTRAALRGFEQQLGVAVSNSHRSTVVSGEPRALAELLEKLGEGGVFCRRVRVDVASHSPQVDPLLDELARALADIGPSNPVLPMYSTVTDSLVSDDALGAAYWVDNLRKPVLFAQAIDGLAAQGIGHFLEISPHPLLTSAIEEIGRDANRRSVAVGSLRREQPERRSLLDSLGVLHVQGRALDTARFPCGGGRVALPTYPFDRARFWLTPAIAPHGGRATAHPMLGARLPSAGVDAVYETVLAPGAPAWLADHCVGGRVLAPGAALFELIRAAAADHDGESALARAFIQAPLVLEGAAQRRVQVVLGDNGRRASIHSQPLEADPDAPWVLHATAELERGPRVPSPEPLDISGLRERCARPFAIEAAYERFRSARVEYGPAFRGLRQLWCGDGEALAEVELPAALAGESYGVQPALLDAAMQSLVALIEPERAKPFLPVELGRFIVHRSGARSALVHARALELRADGVLADLTLTDASGAVLAEAHGFYARAVDVSALAARSEASLGACYYRLNWRPAEAPSLAALTGEWAVVAMNGAADADAAARTLTAPGASVTALALTELAESTADGVVCVWGASQGADAAVEGAQAGLHAARALLARARPPRLVWVTVRAIGVLPSDDVAVASASAWGLGRTLRRERPDATLTLIDVDDEAALATAVLHAARLDDPEPEAAWRAGQRYVPRLVRSSYVAPGNEAANRRLAAARPGTLDSLALVDASRCAPAAGQVEIEVAAAGLNFKDVLTALGMLPENPLPLGGECAGIVTRVGAGVHGIVAGDRVLALAAGSFARFVVADQRLVAPVPSGISLDQAATLPIAFMTAWYALHDLAAVRAGERVLVHTATGGVGLAAIQIARNLGAEVLATASPSKWHVLHSLGVNHVASSRDLEFVGAFRAARGGVDVVLNALAGDFVDAGASLLGQGGRFVEMGRLDVRAPEAMARAHPGITYSAFALTDVPVDRLAEMLHCICAEFERGRLRALPTRAFDVEQAEAAFRFMAQARHVGKLALVATRARPARGATVLITGGLGALGLEFARSFARQGVRHLVLVGRRGATTPEAREAVRELEALGAAVTVAAIDITDRDAVARLIASAGEAWPLRGVIHAAGVLDDGAFSELTPERVAAVMAPKVKGAWNLHELTRETGLDTFAVVSSIAGTFGSPGQSGYAAANTFLDALVAHRRAVGQPALSIALGPFRDRGLAAEHANSSRLAREGLTAFPIADAAALLAGALRRESELVVADIDWSRPGDAPAEAVPTLWRELALPAEASAIATTDDLVGLDERERASRLDEIVRAEVARVLSISNSLGVPPTKPLKELGLDSLMALELRNALSRRTGLKLPATLAFAHPTVQAISAHLLACLGGSGSAALQSNAASAPADARFEAGAVLPPDVIPTATNAPITRPENILLTGATGFLGAYLLRDLLAQTGARIHCLVRARDAADGARRIAENLRQYGLWNDAVFARLRVLPGDLGAPRLGLDASLFDELAQTMDAVYNNGAQLSFIGSYADLEASHVGGTVEILRLATRGRAKAVHHVSSAAVFDSVAYGGRAVAEAERPTESFGLHLGYAQCKWAAEWLVWRAAERGLAVTVHRPAFIAGSSSDGAWNPADFLCRMTRAILSTGIIPNDLDIDLDCSPVDYVSRAIVRLSSTAEVFGSAFHLQNPTSLSFEAFGDLLRSLGYSIRGVSYRDWVERLDSDSQGPLQPLLPFLTQRWPPHGLTSVELWQRAHRPRLTCERTVALLGDQGIECPTLDAGLMTRYLESLERKGLLPTMPGRSK